MEPKLTVGTPRHFGKRQIVMVNVVAFGIVALTFPVAVVIFVPVFVVAILSEFGGLAVLVCGTAYGAVLISLLPLMNNIYIARLVRNHIAKSTDLQDCTIVQIAFFPRMYSGLRGFNEDADDVGYLCFSEEGFQFTGDSINLTLPYDAVDRIQDRNIGYRGMWVASRRLRVYTEAIPPYIYVEFLERQSFWIGTSRRVAAQIVRKLMMKTQLSAD